MNPTRSIPPLPSIDDDIELVLEVHTHRDLRVASHRDSQWDSERLADLGAKALEAVVTYHFFEIRPYLPAEEIAVKRERYTSAITLNDWVELYDLKRRLRAPPNQSDAILNDIEEMKTYFQTYVGAVCATKGLLLVQNWISRLIDPNSNPEQFQASARQSTQDGIGSQIPNQTNSNSNFSAFPAPGYAAPSPGYAAPSSSYAAPSPSYATQSPNYATQSPNYASQSHSDSVPPPPAASPPPLPQAQPPLSGSINFIPLSLVNQTAVQKGYSINYVASQEGPSHQPTWTIRCLINNIERGLGRGKNQKLAKEEAARRAWLAMDW